MRRLLLPPLYITIYQAALCVPVSVIALLWWSDLPGFVRFPLISLNAIIAARIAVMWVRVELNRRRGGY